jgi:acyl-CoA dehydrogenase
VRHRAGSHATSLLASTAPLPFRAALAVQSSVQDAIAESRADIDSARLLTLSAAHAMDSFGNRVAAQQIALIKLAAPSAACRVIDRAIQLWGGAGVSDDTELAYAYTAARSLRLADGPDAVHSRTVARAELLKAKL